MAKLSLDERLEKARQREAQAKARRLALEQRASTRQRTAENHEKFLIGATVLNAMGQNAELRKTVSGLLDTYLTKPQDRARVARWLPAQQ